MSLKEMIFAQGIAALGLAGAAWITGPFEAGALLVVACLNFAVAGCIAGCVAVWRHLT